MLDERLRNAIADLILSGAISPGARLDEQALADRFEVSRTRCVKRCISLRLPGWSRCVRDARPLCAGSA